MQRYPIDKSNSTIKYWAMAIDYFVVIVLMMGFIMYTNVVPDYFEQHIRVILLATSFSFLWAEFIYPPIVQERHIRFERILGRLSRVVIVQSLLMFVLLKYLHLGTPIKSFMIAWVTTYLFVMILLRYMEHTVIRSYRAAGGNSQSSVLVGHDPVLLSMYKRLTSDLASGYRFVGYYGDEEIKDAPAELKHLGNVNDFVVKSSGDVMNEKKHIADVVFCSLPHTDNEIIDKIMLECDKHVMHFYYIPRMIVNYRMNLKPEIMAGIGVMARYEEPLMRLRHRTIKRAFDIVFSLLVLICLAPVFLIVAAIIKTQSPGPIFFRQDRTGLNGTNFRIFKFRSMHVNSDADRVQATKDDPRKFAFGNFMRKTNIDELPQFINVLRGEMSVVGPRPHMLLHTKVYSDLISKYMVRHFAKPGVTGWAQVSGWRGETEELYQMEERVKHDIWYIEHWSFKLDIYIIWKTVANMICHNEEKAY